MEALVRFLTHVGELLLVLLVYGAAFPTCRLEQGPAQAGPDSQEEPDEELMRKYVAGDKRAFDKLVLRYKRRVYGYIWRWVWSKDKADELFQESFYKVVRAAESYDPERRFSSWLFTVVRNTIIDDRKKRRLWVTSLNKALYPGETKRTVADLIPDPTSEEGEELARESELHKALHRALDRLNPDQKEVFLLRHEEGLQFQEIAEIQGTPVNTAKTRMRYALESLQRDLKGFVTP